MEAPVSVAVGLILLPVRLRNALIRRSRAAPGGRRFVLPMVSVDRP